MPAAFTSPGETLTSDEYDLLPRGMVGGAEKTANQTGISAAADVSSLSVTWTAQAGRRYRLSTHVIVEQQTSTGQVAVMITTSGNTQVQTWQEGVGSGQRATCAPWVTLSGLSGSVTYKVRASTSAGTVDVLAASTAPALLLVEDIGE